MLLLEIIAGNFSGELNWLGAERCEFEMNDVRYGVFFEDLDIRLPTKTLWLTNVSFGTLHDTFASIDDLDLSLTNLENAASVLNAVATVVLKRLTTSNTRILVFGGADDEAGRRENVYRLAASRLMHKLNFKSVHTVKTERGESLCILLKDELTDDEIRFVLSGLSLQK